jgi:N12 class adenine-specific DNA methylase
MRVIARKCLDINTMFLPGFEPEGFEPVVTDVLPVAVSRPREVAVAAATTIDSVDSELTVLTSENDVDRLIEALSIVDDEQAGEIRTWPSFNISELHPPRGELARIEHNIGVLALAKELRETGRAPNEEEVHSMLRYSGWGSIARIFESGLDGKSLAQSQLELQRILNDDEWKSARATTPNAHYTDPRLVSLMWALVEKLGFKGGHVLEPTAGTGLFLAGMPKSVAEKSTITAVELDTVSGGLLKSVFSPLGVNVLVQGLEKANLPKNFYQLVIGNLPFGNYRVPDTSKSPYADWSIHNWCIGRSLDLLAPGGIMVVVTSTYTMDGSSSVRSWINTQAELIEAIRLPEGAFARQAATDVVTDILVLRKRKFPKFGEKALWTMEAENAPEEMLIPGQSLSDSKYVHGRQVEIVRNRKINQWFSNHPSRVVGKLKLRVDRFGKRGVSPIFDGAEEDLYQHLGAVVEGIVGNVYEMAEKIEPVEISQIRKVQATSDSRPGQFVLHGAKLCISEGSTWIDVDALYVGKARERVLGMMEVRDAARALIEYQRDNTSDDGLAVRQEALNRVFDRYVASNGWMHEKMNVRAFRSDPDFPLLLSLEQYDEELKVGRKSDIFTKRTINRRSKPESVDNVRDGLLMSLGELGSISVPYIARLARMKRKQVESALQVQGLAFRNPQSGEWVAADEYLSGHVREKLCAAKAGGKGYEMNVLALESVLPEPLGPGEIKIPLGAPWVPTKVIRDFIVDTLEMRESDTEGLEVLYSPEGAVWSLKYKYSIDCLGAHAMARLKWGTRERSFGELLQGALNQQPPTITQTVNGKSVVDQRATLQAREKYEAIRTRFQSWVYEDLTRSDELVRIYNERFNQVVLRKWNGEHLTLPGLSNVYRPYAHQLNAVWRIVSGGNTLLAHCVGAGKSLTMFAAAMELRRLGKAKKPLIACPGHMLYQMAGEFLKAYPDARVLIADKDSLFGDKRREFTARIATGDWDCVLMTHTSFERIPVRPRVQQEFVDQMLDKVRLAEKMASDRGAKRSVKELEKRLKNLDARLSKDLAQDKKDDLVYYDELGIDYLFVDELHLFKSLMRISKMPRIAGLPNSSSQRAFDLFIKSSLLSAMLGGKEEGLVGATATPISNSVAEMHVMMRYIQPKTLEEYGIDEFDAWAATFGEAVTGLELAPDGSGYRMNTRFSRFCNVSELISLFMMRADIQTDAMLKLPKPEIVGGSAKVIQCEASGDLKLFTNQLVARADKVRGRGVDPKDDNMLKISTEGRLAAIDMRLINPALPADPNGKLAHVVKEMMRIYKETADRKGTQLMFCDVGVPNASGFSVYQQLRDDLIDAGIPECEIAFMQDYSTDKAKESLFGMVRAGSKRFLFGSTENMGIGTNVQTLLRAIHHVSVPWRPCDLVQRDGRALRTGNTWSEVEILRYVVVGSFDAFSWQLLATKQAFTDQIMGGDRSVRSVEDISVSALTYSEIKAIASGNPLVLERANVEAEIVRLNVARDVWANDRWQARQTAHRSSQEKQHIESMLSAALEDQADALKLIEDGFVFKPASGSIAKAADEQSGLIAKIGEACRKASLLSATMGDLRVGAIGPFEVNVRRSFSRAAVEVVLPNTGLLRKLEPRFTQIEETGKSVIDEIKSVAELHQNLTNRVADLVLGMARCEQIASCVFEHEERLAGLLVRQAAIAESLDLNKDMDGAVVADAESAQA